MLPLLCYCRRRRHGRRRTKPASTHRRPMILEYQLLWVFQVARESIPESGSGRVMYLVQTFERLLSLPRDSEAGDEKESKDVGKGMKWVLPGLQEWAKAQKTEESSSLFCPGNFSLTVESLRLNPVLRHRMKATVEGWFCTLLKL
ncbi:hypothetical protein Droror1_Dr00006404 [Drosera rotundifolia]